MRKIIRTKENIVVSIMFLFVFSTLCWSAWSVPTWGIKEVVMPTDGWPISHTNAGAAKLTTIKTPPTNGQSYYLTGMMMMGGGDGDGFKLIRGASNRWHGVNDDLTVTHALGLRPMTSDFAVEMWVRLESPGGAIPSLFDKHDGGAPADGILLQVTAANKFQFNIADGAEEAIFTTDDAFALDAWHHVVVSVDRSSFCKIYVNNVDEDVTASGDALSTVTDAINNVTDITIESPAEPGFHANCIAYYIGGFLSASDVSDHYNSGYGKKFSGDETNMKFGFNIDEGTGLVATNILTPGTTDGDFAAGFTEWKDATDMVDYDGPRPNDSHTLGETAMITVGALANAEGVFPGVFYTFPHAIKIGLGNSIYISETDGAFTLLLFGFEE